MDTEEDTSLQLITYKMKPGKNKEGWIVRVLLSQLGL